MPRLAQVVARWYGDGHHSGPNRVGVMELVIELATVGAAMTGEQGPQAIGVGDRCRRVGDRDRCGCVSRRARMHDPMDQRQRLRKDKREQHEGEQRAAQA